MTSDTAQKLHPPPDTRRLHTGQFRSEPAAAEAKLSPRAGLIAALLLSLGLWGAIWQTVLSVPAAWLR